MEELKFQKDQLLAYGASGVCVVHDIEKVRITSDSRPEMYYILKQKKDKDSKILVPVQNERLTGKMRELLTKDEVIELIKGVMDENIEWIPDRRSRNDQFKKIMAEGIGMNLLRMIVCIYERKVFLDKEGKKLPVTDATTLKSAEKLVQEEFSYVLEIEQDEVNAYMRNIVEGA